MRFMLRDFREARGIEVGAMCARLGVKDSRYRKWESGVGRGSVDGQLPFGVTA